MADLVFIWRVVSEVHQHPAGLVDNLKMLQVGIRILEVVGPSLLLGIIFFRYWIWREPKGREPPEFFSLQREWITASFNFAVFMASSGLHSSPLTWLSTTLTGIWLIMALVTKRTRSNSLDAIKLVTGTLILMSVAVQVRVSENELPLNFASLFYVIHFLSAAVWFAGIVGLYTITLQKYANVLTVKEMNSMINRFSLIALPLILMMIGSGILITVIRLQEWQQLFTTFYGKYILIKCLLLSLVILIAFYHRTKLIPSLGLGLMNEATKRYRKIKHRFNNAVRVEISIAVILFIFSGMLSGTSLPQISKDMDSIYWHVMGSKAHMSFKIRKTRSVAPRFELYIWLRSSAGRPETVKVYAKKNKQSIAIPLLYKGTELGSYRMDGFDQYSYEGGGYYLNDSGLWDMQVEFLDRLGNKFTYKKSVNITIADILCEG